MIKRRKTRVIDVGGVKIGGANPVSIQSMLKVKTSRVEEAIKQARGLERLGCEIIRVAVKDFDDTKAILRIKKRVKAPIVADIHFDYRLALDAIKNGADKIRINPGNISGQEELKEIIKAAKKRKIPVRIGVNSGSVPAGRDIADYALKAIKFFERQKFRDIIISLKSSDVGETVSSCRMLAKLCDYPLHLGVTAAGPYEQAIVKSSIGIGALLLDGIGDTIRISLTGDPVGEVIAAKSILQAAGVRRFTPDIISCPTCGRCQVNLIKIVEDFKRRTKDEGRLSAVAERESNSAEVEGTNRPISIALMGCEVNGPGEAKEADIGIAFGKGTGIIFKKGRIIKRVKAKDAVRELIRLVLEARGGLSS